MKSVWVPLLMSAAALVGLGVGHVSGRLSANSDFRLSLDSLRFEHLPLGGNSKIGNIINLVRTNYVEQVNIDSLEEAVIPDFLKQLDPHSVYIPRKDLTRVDGELKSNFGGIGVTFSVREDTVCVMSVVSGGPSSALGILPGDKIIKVNGRDFVGKSINNQTVMDSLRGEIGTHVLVSILRKPDTVLDYDITRGEIPLTSVDISYEIAPHVGYISIDRFAEKTYEEMMAGIAKLRAAGCTSLIVDLRSNSGGFLNVVMAMCNEFLQRGDLIVYTEGAHHARSNSYADGTGSCKDMKLVVLIDEYSASASEIFSGAMQDNDRGTIIGRRSFGKGLVQREMLLPDQSAIRLTVERYHTPSGRCIQRPYENGTEDYYADVNVRFKSGELFSADSIKADTTQIFHTRKGRVVYGGGGIIPDVFVPYDSVAASPFLYKLRAKRMMYDFAISYANDHRAELKSISTDELIRKLLATSFYSDIVAYASKRSLVAPKSPKLVERQIIENEVRAYVAQSIAGNDGFYPFLHILDPVIEKALQGLDAIPIYQN